VLTTLEKQSSALLIPRQRPAQKQALPASASAWTKWMASLESLAPAERISAVSKQIKLLNRTSCSAKARLTVATKLQSFWQQRIADLMPVFSGQDLPMTPVAFRAYNESISVLTEQSYCFMVALDNDIRDEDLTPVQRAWACLSAMRALRQRIEIHLDRYHTIPSVVLADLYTLYSLAQDGGYHTLKLKHQPETIEHAFKHCLMLSIVDAWGLGQGQLRLFSEKLQIWTREIELREHASETGTGCYSVDLSSDSLPAAYAYSADNDKLLWLHTNKLLEIIKTASEQAQLPSTPREHSNTLHGASFQHLNRTLLSRPERVSARAHRADMVAIEIGLKDIHSRLEQGGNLKVPPNPEWQLTNQSAEGLGLVKNRDSAAPVHVGELIAVSGFSRDAGNPVLRMGTVQWLRYDIAGKLRCGIHLVAHDAKPVIASHKIEGQRVNRVSRESLYVSPEPGMHYATLIVTANTFSTGQVVTLHHHGRPGKKWRLTVQARQTASMACFRIEPVA